VHAQQLDLRGVGGRQYAWQALASIVAAPRRVSTPAWVRVYHLGGAASMHDRRTANGLANRVKSWAGRLTAFCWRTCRPVQSPGES
jgi:hypothetical protein